MTGGVDGGGGVVVVLVVVSVMVVMMIMPSNVLASTIWLSTASACNPQAPTASAPQTHARFAVGERCLTSVAAEQ